MTAPSLPEDPVGLHGDFWTRFLLGVLRRFPAWFCVGITWPLTLFFYTLAARQRRAVQANLRALKSDWSWLTLQLASYRVFAEFALAYMDRMWSLHLGQQIEWDAEDYSHLNAQLHVSTGVLLFTTHSGNFDVGATFLSHHFPRPIHVVRLRERSESLHEFREAELKEAAKAHPGLQVHYASDDWNLGIELCRLLRAGEVVAVQGDRAPDAAHAVQFTHEEISYRLPKGPLVLAQIARVPCYPIFVRRLGRCRYCIRTGPPFYDGHEKKTAEEIGAAWVGAMAEFVSQHWAQWFVFEHTVERTDPASA